MSRIVVLNFLPNDVHQNFIERLGMAFQFIIRSLLNTTFHYHHNHNHNHNHLLLFFYHIYIYIYIYIKVSVQLETPLVLPAEDLEVSHQRFENLFDWLDLKAGAAAMVFF